MTIEEMLLRRKQRATPQDYALGVGNTLINMIPGRGARAFGQNPNDSINRLYEQMALAQYKNELPGADLERRLKEQQILESEATTEALKQPLPQGFTLVGGKPVRDPSFVDPTEQRQREKEQRKEQEDALLMQRQEELAKQTAKENLQTIEEIKSGIGYFGPYGTMPSRYAPETLLGLNAPAYSARRNWEANIDKLLASKILDLMTSLKKTSKTGATGFGQLSEKELALLQGASTALKRDLSPEQAKFYLDQMEQIHRKILGGQEVPTTQQIASPPSQRKIGRFIVEG